MRNSTPLKALVLTALAPVIWSTGGIAVRILEVTPATILFWRSLFMTATLLCWTVIQSRRRASPQIQASLRQGLPVALFLAMAFIFYVYSVTNTSIADSLLIQGTAPIFIVLLGWLILHEKLRPITIIALLLVVTGITIIMLQSLRIGGLSGNIYGLAKAVAFAAGTIAIRSRKSIGLLPATTIAAGLSTLFALTLSPDFTPDLYSLGVLAYLGIFQVGVGFILFVTWSGKLSSSQTGLLVILEAVLGPIWPWIFLGDRPYPLTFVGGAIIVAALVLHTLLYQRHTST